MFAGSEAGHILGDRRRNGADRDHRDGSVKLVAVETAYMLVKHRRAGNLEVAFNLMENEAYDDKYSVCWIDCLSRGRKMGRSVLMTGHHAVKSEVPLMSRDPLHLKKKRTKDLNVNGLGSC